MKDKSDIFTDVILNQDIPDEDKERILELIDQEFKKQLARKLMK